MDRPDNSAQTLVVGHPAAVTPRQPEELLLAEMGHMFRRRRRFIAAWIVAGLLIAVAYLFLRSPVYEASAEIEISPVGTNAFGLNESDVRNSSVTDPTVRLESAAEIMRGDAVAIQVMQQLKMSEHPGFAGKLLQPPGTSMESLPPVVRDKLLARFRKALQVEIVPKTDIVAVRFRARDAQLAADVVNCTLTSYSERKFRSSYDSARQVSSWLSRQMEDLKAKANQSQERLAEFQKDTGLVGVDETDNIVTEKLKSLSEQLTAAEAERIVKEARFRLASSGNPELLVTAVNDSALQLLRSQQAELRLQYAQLSTTIPRTLARGWSNISLREAQSSWRNSAALRFAIPVRSSDK